MPVSATIGLALRIGGLWARLRERRRRIDRSGVYREGWREAAERRGWPADDLGRGFVRVQTPRGPLLLHGAHVGVDDIATFHLAGDKVVSAGLLRDAGLPVADSSLFAVGDPALLGELRRRGDAVVVKPAADTGGGSGVTVRPSTVALGVHAVIDAAADGPAVLVEAARPGRAVRVLVLDGEVLDAVERSPAAVVGDGTRRIDELVAAENRRRASLGARATGFIGTGADHRAALRRAGLGRRSRPASGRVVVVAGRSNSGSELESRRVAVTSEAAEVACRAAATIGVRLAGVDLLVDDEGRPVAVLEVNTAPGLHWHVLVAGEPYDVFSEVLGRLGDG
jgi:D-alanine-D-alanine ligase-like ATP-grasp enzyme